MTPTLQTLDVRPILKTGGEPFQEIMKAVSQLGTGEGLRLLATFKPVPLFAVMQKKGYTHGERELGGGDWEVVFTPEPAAALGTAAAAAPASNAAASPRANEPVATGAAQPGHADATGWPTPRHSLDNRDMLPPEPLVITLEAAEGMADGEVLEAFYDREPMLLYPELKSRGHAARCEKLGPNDYRVLIRIGGGAGA